GQAPAPEASPAVPDAIAPDRSPEPSDMAELPRTASTLPDDAVADAVTDAIAEVLREAGSGKLAPDAGATRDALDDDGNEDLASIADNRPSRRDLLPDIEEINSSLRPDERALEAEQGAGAPDSHQIVPVDKTAFRTGFLAVVLVCFAAVMAYALAPQIAAAVPGLAEALAGYVAWIDAQRAALEVGADALTTRILPVD
ncbi:MAG: hypothetical protein WBA67_07235, partial [Jannaschia sp.]